MTVHDITLHYITYLHTYIHCIQIYTYVCKYVNTYNIYIYTYVYIYIFIYIYLNMYIIVFFIIIHLFIYLFLCVYVGSQTCLLEMSHSTYRPFVPKPGWAQLCVVVGGHSRLCHCVDKGSGVFLPCRAGKHLRSQGLIQMEI